MYINLRNLISSLIVCYDTKVMFSRRDDTQKIHEIYCQTDSFFNVFPNHGLQLTLQLTHFGFPHGFKHPFLPCQTLEQLQTYPIMIKKPKWGAAWNSLETLWYMQAC